MLDARKLKKSQNLYFFGLNYSTIIEAFDETARSWLNRYSVGQELMRLAILFPVLIDQIKPSTTCFQEAREKIVSNKDSDAICRQIIYGYLINNDSSSGGRDSCSHKFFLVKSCFNIAHNYKEESMDEVSDEEATILIDYYTSQMEKLPEIKMLIEQKNPEDSLSESMRNLHENKINVYNCDL